MGVSKANGSCKTLTILGVMNENITYKLCYKLYKNISRIYIIYIG